MLIKWCLLLIFLCQSAYADMIPCLKWRDITMANLNEIFPDIKPEEKNKIYGLIGQVSEKPSKKCLQKYDLKEGVHKIGYAKLFLEPKRVISGLCKAEFFTENLIDEKWVLSKERGYAVALQNGSSCNSRPVTEFISLTDEIEDKAAEMIVKNGQNIYQQYISNEKDHPKGMKLSAIGLETTESLNTHYVLVYTSSCSSLNLLVRVNDNQQLEYVSHYWVLC